MELTLIKPSTFPKIGPCLAVLSRIKEERKRLGKLNQEAGCNPNADGFDKNDFQVRGVFLARNEEKNQD